MSTTRCFLATTKLRTPRVHYSRPENLPTHNHTSQTNTNTRGHHDRSTTAARSAPLLKLKHMNTHAKHCPVYALNRNEPMYMLYVHVPYTSMVTCLCAKPSCPVHTAFAHILCKVLGPGALAHISSPAACNVCRHVYIMYVCMYMYQML